MLKRYVYRNLNNQPVNIGGYQFGEGQELESDIRINGFNEAVNNGFLELTEQEPQGAEPDVTPAPQTGDTGKVKVIFHMGMDGEGKEAIKEIEIDPAALIDFPGIDLRENETFDGWFKDAGFTKAVNVEKAKAPKKGDAHFYGKYSLKDENSQEPPIQNSEEGSEGENRQVTVPPLPSPPISSSIDDEPSLTDPKNK
jgi:hypothetical protein